MLTPNCCFRGLDRTQASDLTLGSRGLFGVDNGDAETVPAPSASWFQNQPGWELHS